jgi:cytochrome b subunit of formate dehydrogenase
MISHLAVAFNLLVVVASGVMRLNNLQFLTFLLGGWLAQNQRLYIFRFISHSSFCPSQIKQSLAAFKENYILHTACQNTRQHFKT